MLIIHLKQHIITTKCQNNWRIIFSTAHCMVMSSSAHCEWPLKNIAVAQFFFFYYFLIFTMGDEKYRPYKWSNWLFWSQTENAYVLTIISNKVLIRYITSLQIICYYLLINQQFLWVKHLKSKRIFHKYK